MKPVNLSTGGALLVHQSDGTTVTHGYAAIQTHEHWTATLEIKADGFKTQQFKVEVPRKVGSPPIEVVLAIELGQHRLRAKQSDDNSQ